jgi:hypothetical protein
VGALRRRSPMARKTYPEEKILSVLKEVADGATIAAA